MKIYLIILFKRKPYRFYYEKNRSISIGFVCDGRYPEDHDSNQDVDFHQDFRRNYRQ